MDWPVANQAPPTTLRDPDLKGWSLPDLWLSVVLESRTPCHPECGLGPATGHIMNWGTPDTTPDLQKSTGYSQTLPLLTV